MLDPWSLRQSKWKKKLALMLTHRSMLNSATFIHALNADERDLIGPLRICAPIEVIPNGIFLEEVRSAITSGQDETTALPEAPYILFLSRLHYKKGLDILAEAFIWVAKQHPNVNLVVAGPDQGARNDLVTRIEAAGLSSRVQVVGPLYGADKYRAMSRCLCFCLPSRQEGFSVAILEALSVGAPAVISNECHFPEVGELSAGIVTKLDSESVAEALNHLLGNQALREAMATNARALVENRFTWQKVADLTLNAYLRRSK
jgi:glycosyltransferase involved in cell wall biosynthesis